MAVVSFLQDLKFKSEVKVQEKAEPGQNNSQAQISVISLLLARF